MQQGTVAKKMPQGFGFIKVDGAAEDDKDLFFHATELQGITFDDLNEGDTVEFEKIQGDKGPQAQNVSKVDASESSPAEAEAD